MTPCNVCFGSGKIRCSPCRGTGYISRLTQAGDMDMSPCAVCGGQGKIRCEVCGGAGQAKTAGERVSKRRSADLLEGQWFSADGSSLEFTKQGLQYSVKVNNAQGQAGSGTATLNGNVVNLQAKILLFIPYKGELRLDGNTLRGRLGPLPLVFYRA